MPRKELPVSPTCRRIAGVVAGLVLACASPATASFKGTPGKVADINADLKLEIWDPVDRTAQVITVTVEPQSDGSQWGTNGRPVWSPDGTRVAFTKTVPDSGSYETNGQPVDKHTAIFIYDI